MKTYIITSGDYSDYRIIAQLVGSEKPSISSLYKRFNEKFEIPDYPQMKKRQTIGRELEEYYEKLTKSAEKIQEYYKEEYIDSKTAFIRYLTEECGFLVDKNSEEFHI